MKKISEKAFTATEMICAIIIFAALVTLMSTALKDIMPNENKAKFKQGYYTLEQVVYSLANDGMLYPTGKFSDTSSISVDGVKYEGNTKFYKAFKSKLNILEDDFEISGLDGYKCFTTNANLTYCMLTDFCNGTVMGNLCVSNTENPPATPADAASRCTPPLRLPTTTEIQQMCSEGLMDGKEYWTSQYNRLYRCNFLFYGTYRTGFNSFGYSYDVQISKCVQDIQSAAITQDKTEIIFFPDFDKTKYDALPALTSSATGVTDCKKQYRDMNAFYFSVDKDGKINIETKIECFKKTAETAVEAIIEEDSCFEANKKVKHHEFNQCRTAEYLKSSKIGE